MNNMDISLCDYCSQLEDFSCWWEYKIKKLKQNEFCYSCKKKYNITNIPIYYNYHMCDVFSGDLCHFISEPYCFDCKTSNMEKNINIITNTNLYCYDCNVSLSLIPSLRILSILNILENNINIENLPVSLKNEINSK